MFMQIAVGAIGIAIVLMVGFIVISDVQASLSSSGMPIDTIGNITSLNSTTIFAGFGLLAVGIIVLAAFGMINVFNPRRDDKEEDEDIITEEDEDKLFCDQCRREIKEGEDSIECEECGEEVCERCISDLESVSICKRCIKKAHPIKKDTVDTVAKTVAESPVENVIQETKEVPTTNTDSVGFHGPIK